ncbi:TlpA family protein disulfide reductase [bacterium]|nr:TlpA family protein disulfide reductase [bacterium]
MVKQLINIQKQGIDPRWLAVLVFSLCLMTATAWGGTDQEAFEEDFGIVRFQQPQAAPDFSLRNLEQHEVRLGEYKNRFVLLNFWATWCLPCVRELPQLEELRRILPEADFQILAINVRDRESRLRKFLASRPYGFKIPIDQSGEVYKAFGVTGFPTTFLIDRQGMLFGKISGARDWINEGFVPYLQHLLEKGDRNE